MKQKRMKSKVTVLALLITVMGVTIELNTSTAYADSLGTITRGAFTTARGQTAEGSDGNIWFSGSRGQITKAAKTGNTSTTYTFDNTNTWYLNSITRGSDGNVWFTYDTKIAKVTPTGTISSYQTPAGYNGPTGYIASGNNGDIWVSNTRSVNNVNFFYIHRYNSSGEILSTYPTAGNATFLAFDRNSNNTWFIEPTTNTVNGAVAVGKIDVNGTLSEYTIPGIQGMPSGLAQAPDGSVWFSVNSGSNSSTIGKVDINGNYTLVKTLPYFLSSVARGFDGNMWLTSTSDNKVIRAAANLTPSGSINEYSTVLSSFGSSPNGVSAGSDGNMWFTESSHNHITRIGTGVNASDVDADGDGLTSSQESAQGTSDLSVDSDFDGLTDYTESSSNAARNSLFCNVNATYCEYPSPTQRDLYVEADWMVKPGVNGYSMQPTSGQVSAIKNAYANKGVLAHIDTGLLGGGNEVPYASSIAMIPTTSTADFYDYKYGGDNISTAQFTASRQHIYHYVIFGDHFKNVDGSLSYSTGATYAGDDDTFVAYGRVADLNPSSLDAAIEGTTFHELGHSLCLTNGATSAYPQQSPSCRSTLIDANSGSGYQSAMNYDYQFSVLDYSSGTNGNTVDHDDWSALRMQDFAFQTNSQDPEPGVGVGAKKHIKRVHTRLQVGPSKKSLR
jgi:streptogramin lyase